MPMNPLSFQTSSKGAIFSVQFNNIQTEMLYDTGASRSCISEEFYQLLPHKSTLTPVGVLNVQGANGGNLHPIGLTMGTLSIGTTSFIHHFLVLKSLKVPLIMGLDLQKKYGLCQDWTRDGKMLIKHNKDIMISSIRINEQLPVIYAPDTLCIPAEGISALPTKMRNLEEITDI